MQNLIITKRLHFSQTFPFWYAFTIQWQKKEKLVFNQFPKDQIKSHPTFFLIEYSVSLGKVTTLWNNGLQIQFYAVNNKALSGSLLVTSPSHTINSDLLPPCYPLLCVCVCVCYSVL